MIKLEIVPEYALSNEAVRHITELRAQSAARHQSRPALFGSPPAFMALLRTDDVLVGHVRFDFQQLLLDLQPVNVFCLYELCFSSEAERKRHFQQLLEGIEGLGRQQSVEFVVLFSAEPNWLLAHGFEVCTNVLLPPRTAHLSDQLLSEQLLLVKALGSQPWKPGRLQAPSE